MTDFESNLLNTIALNLNVLPGDLFKLIQFESKWNPKAENRFSTAKGLIQFTDSTAKSLGFKSSLDLIKQNPSIADQLPIVEKYLSRFKPFPTKQSLYMSVFYPIARYWNQNKFFPEYVQKVNPGIRTVRDYINKVEGLTPEKTIVPIIAGIAVLYFILKRKVKQ